MASAATEPERVNNDIYSTLGERWYEAEDDPVALLRAESRLRTPWVASHLTRVFPERACKVLDVGCGAGFLTNSLAERGHDVTGVDASAAALEIAALHDPSASVRYELADAARLPYDDATFDAVCAMDLLEHVEDPRAIVRELARVLVPGGLCFFHTFNRTFLSWLIVIKGVELFVRNTPEKMHILRLFLRPDEVTSWLHEEGVHTTELVGSRPVVNSAFLRMLVTGQVSNAFEFCFSDSTQLGYTGCARKRDRQ